MAKYSCELHGSFYHFCQFLKKELIESSFSASIEDEHYYNVHDVHVGILIFERYSYTGKNRLSLSITITEYQNNLHVTAISSGGSQAMFFKINTFGEDAFLDKFKEAIQNYKSFPIQ